MSSSKNPSLVTSQLPFDGEEYEAELLKWMEDSYGGVIVHLEATMDVGAFVRSLRASLSKWRHLGKKEVRMKLPIEQSHLVHAAVQEGFWYHHTEPTYLMLVNWIPDTPHTIPVNATHRVGIGAFVMNDKREVLVVQEKTRILQGTGVWKFPTGIVDAGEDIFLGAIREVKEETGVSNISTEFVEVLGFRFSLSSSNLYSTPTSFTHDIVKQEAEIEDAQWMPIGEYAAQPFIQSHESLRKIIDICIARIDKGYRGFSRHCPKSPSLSVEESFLYFNSRDLNGPSSSD
ncbi:hypothetical protein AMTRI_Chr10g232020 [Amborella trichopoda]